MCFFLCGVLGATLEGSSMGHLSLPYSEEPVVYPHIVRVSDVKESHRGHAVISRRKRNILFPSGVKLCAQETAQQVVANHLNYFHLRGEAQHQHCESRSQCWWTLTLHLLLSGWTQRLSSLHVPTVHRMNCPRKRFNLCCIYCTGVKPSGVGRHLCGHRWQLGLMRFTYKTGCGLLQRRPFSSQGQLKENEKLNWKASFAQLN